MSGNCIGAFDYNITIHNQKLALHENIGKSTAHHLSVNAHTFPSFRETRQWNMNFTIFRYEVVNDIRIMFILIFVHKPLNNRLSLTL